MSHTITSKLNKPARQHANANGVTFFVDLGEKNYNFQTKENEYTNYSAALFAKDGQIAFYQSILVEGAVIEVTGTGLIMEVQTDSQYKPKLMIQDAKLGYTFNPNQVLAQQTSSAPQAPARAPQMAPAYQPAQQPAPMNETDLGWVKAVKADPSMINQIEDSTYKTKIQLLVSQQ